MHAIAVVVSLSLGQFPMVFLGPGDLADARNLQVEAQRTEDIITLLPKDPARPKLWYSPAAAFSEDGATRIWYQRVDGSEAEFQNQRTLCVGELREGAWTLLKVQETPPAWGSTNNIVLTRSSYKPTWGGFNVFQIVRAPGLYKMLYWDQPESGEAGAMLATSPDGLHWAKDPRGAVFTEHNDAYTLMPDGGNYLLYQTTLEAWADKPYPDNLDKYRRVQSLRSSPDLVQWTPQEVFLRPDAQDKPETEFYLLKTFPYAGRYAGVLFKYFADPDKPGRHSALYAFELIAGNSPRTWERPFREVDLGFWLYADPFYDSGKLCFVFGKEGALQVARYRPNGLTAVVARETGEYITPAFSAAPGQLLLNADTREGWIELRLLTEDKTPIPDLEPFRLAERDVERLPVAWANLSQYPTPPPPYRLQVTLCRAKLFSIDAESGAVQR